MAKGKKRISIHNLAAELNLSASTISRALNNASDVSESTKAQVWALAEKMNYQPNNMAASLRKGRTNVLGVIVPHIDGAFFPSVVHGIERLASKEGFNVMICQSSEEVAREQAHIKDLLKAQVDGILVSMSDTTRAYDHFEQVRSQGIPLVFFDRMPEMRDVCGVVVDDYRGAYQLTEHLIAQGCQRIAHLAGPRHLNITFNRHQGYHDALLAHGVAYDQQLVVALANSGEDAGVAAMQHLLKAKTRLDAVFAAYDFAAAGAMRVLEENKIRVPQDIALAGFSNEPFATMFKPQLTSVDQRGELMGEAAVQLFLQLQKRTDTFTGQRIVLKPQLLVRASSLHKPVSQPIEARR